MSAWFPKAEVRRADLTNTVRPPDPLHRSTKPQQCSSRDIKVEEIAEALDKLPPNELARFRRSFTGIAMNLISGKRACTGMILPALESRMVPPPPPVGGFMRLETQARFGKMLVFRRTVACAGLGICLPWLDSALTGGRGSGGRKEGR
jgi:hypothetical protein